MTDANPQIAEAVRRYAAAADCPQHAEFALVRADDAHRKGQGIGKAILIGMDAIDVFRTTIQEQGDTRHG